MIKKIALILNGMLLAGVLSWFFLMPVLMGPIQYQLGAPEELERIRQAFVQPEEPFFTELQFSGEALPYDEKTATFYLPLSLDTKQWESGSLTSGQSDVSLLFETEFDKEDKLQAIREGRKYRFLAVRGNEYQECFLTLTGLPVVSIVTEADAEVFGGTAHFWDADKKFNWTSSHILEAHIRGNTSRTYPKKGYKLSLKTQDRNGNVVEDKTSLFGMRTDDEWILNAMYSDDSKIRDKLCTDIWNAFGSSKKSFPNARFGTGFTYVEVFFNHQYWGLYGLMEPVDSKQLDLDRGSGPGKQEYSYKAITPQDIPTQELETVEEWGEELAGFELKGSHESISREAWEPLLRYLKLRDLSDTEEFAEQAPVWIDTDGALDVWIYLQAVLGIDNRAKNMYYVAKYEGNDYKIYFAPWDMDLSFGDALSEGSGERIWNVDMNTNLYSERINWTIGDRLVELNVDQARDTVAKKWKNLRTGILSGEQLNARIDELAYRLQASGALARNEARWPDSDTGADYETFKRMANYRLNILDYYFDGRLETYLGLGYE